MPQEALDELLRDFANPNTNDKFFTFARHKDWFEGHSWAAGVVAFGDGRNQVRSHIAAHASQRVGTHRGGALRRSFSHL